MRVVTRLAHSKIFGPRPVLAIGVFDGVHRGHQKVIQRATREARAIKGTAMVMTFDPHPVHVLAPDVYAPLVVSLSYRLALFERMGIDVCWVMKFNKFFSAIKPEDFVRTYLCGKVRPSVVVIGDDFYFGRKRQGTPEALRHIASRYGIRLICIKTTSCGEKKFSSTRIRSLIMRGKLNEASRLLGRPVSLLGKVAHGDARGRKLGYPTANINPGYEVIPPSGVYVVRVRYGRMIYRGMASIGRRPTFKRMAKVNIEVHLFGFRRNLYGKEIIVEFAKKLRDERIFLSKEELVQQIRKDENRTMAWFRQHPLLA